MTTLSRSPLTMGTPVTALVLRAESQAHCYVLTTCPSTRCSVSLNGCPDPFGGDPGAIWVYDRIRREESAAAEPGLDSRDPRASGLPMLAQLVQFTSEHGRQCVDV